MKVLVTTDPFGKHSEKPRALLNSYFGPENVFYNDKGRKYSQDELHEVLIKIKPDIIIAGTENYGKTELNLVRNLRVISRVGIGVDNIDIKECKKRNIQIRNTPNAPTNAVAELTLCQILNMLRKIQNVSVGMIEKEKWNRYIGRELANCSVGIIGCGRVGFAVSQLIYPFGCNILTYDIIPSRAERSGLVSNIDKILEECDVITIHIPLREENVDNRNFITEKELGRMKYNVRLLNMSRGGIVNEEDAVEWLTNNPKATYAVDTFVNEPYSDKLLKLGNAYPTPHLGSCTIKSRNQMEEGSVGNVLHFSTRRY